MSAPSQDCQDVVELVTDYLEGALDPDTRSRVREHLAGCEGCEIYVEQMRRTAAALGAAGPPPLEASMRDRLLAAFQDWAADGRPPS
jgi:anti-sigma factor RsiW